MFDPTPQLSDKTISFYHERVAIVLFFVALLVIAISSSPIAVDCSSGTERQSLTRRAVRIDDDEVLEDIKLRDPQNWQMQC